MQNLNRPISPHLTIYNPQKASTFSIWHRISGVFMFTIITSSLLILNNLYLSYTTVFLVPLLFKYFLFDWLLFSCKLLLQTIFLYHTINGIRHLLWDSVIHVNTIKMRKDANILLFVAFIIILIQFCVEFQLRK
uniref:Succinate:cytochrome c oxidoreductase subunit 3 n=1 Tax=Pyropia perforata TaxID=182771 RepID=A0A060DCS5_PYRPE|nr:succinate:cytochrome c oxidoreductase subunit 3 [Neoporphyra perforata]AHB35439.1 succinate:cytochrome c oxidoreductase subunit 3 [Neoporphyra perforata]AIB08100.1 succinate:cytochrome c oxidoreductase subunit 3 [Neoporphyra perforata]AIB08246.1 succinate:cytochrome c oxidoreductase subunit 3 [Neoporphyra perforata]AIB08273.1 succinate:cytochrome c oxidoreductase subunit 3 [Neoporphyra perforata]